MHESGQIGQLPVLDPDRSSRPLDKLWGGGVGGGVQKIFFRPFGSHSGLKIGGAGTPGPSRGSDTSYGTLKYISTD